MLMLSVFLVAVVALILGATAPGVWAQKGDEDGPIPLEEAKIIIETNFTDGDAGIQVFLDGEAWNKIVIKDPNGKKIFDVKGKGSLKNFGLTELFFESEEPEFGELALVDILALFPEGYYEFNGKSVEKDKLEGTAVLSHDIPCAPTLASPINGAIVASDAPVTISWGHVTNMLDNAAEDCTGGEIDVETYQVIVEKLETENEFSIYLEAEDMGNQVTLPEEFIEDDTAYKYEVLAIAENGNQTIQETWFCTGPDGPGEVGDPCPDPED